MRREPEVLVVGAGPVGLTLASLLTQYGIEVLVVEQRSGPLPLPRAVSLDDVSGRILSRAGLGAQVDRLLCPGTGTAYYGADGQLLFQAHGPVGRPNGFAFKNAIRQPEVEQALIDHLNEEAPGRLLFRHTWTGYRRAPEGQIVSRVLSPDGVMVPIPSRYLVACDGSHSPVRHQLGIRLQGRHFSQTWLALDVRNDPHRQDCAMHHGEPGRPHVIVPFGDRQCRYEFRLFPGEAEPGKAVPWQLISRLLRPFRTLSAGDLIRAAAYRFGALTAQRWRQGPIFLAGDAAHTMPPFAGAGLNCGLLDASNLAWRLRWVLRQDAPSSLLQDYEAERRPHVEAMTRLSVWLGRVLMTTRPWLARLRDRVVRSAMSSPAWRPYLESAGFRPRPYAWGQAYRFQAPCRALMPNMPVVCQGRVQDLDQALAGRFGLIGAARGLAELERRWPEVPGGRSSLAWLSMPTAAERAVGAPAGAGDFLQDLGSRLLLVRPDGMIAACFPPQEIRAVQWWTDLLRSGPTEVPARPGKEAFEGCPAHG
ncbi:MAG: FAD-dependent monooxygenase [Planctomycetes bacterium]|nr:FAD-dependent monooxygenase [Planctomycetota bacterium]